MHNLNDHQQREYALNPLGSFIVQAPAGSGKTELLTQRFLRLLSCVNAPEEILAITFTKKAASEMRSRIRDALQRAQQAPPPQTPHEQKTWQLASHALEQDKKYNWGLLGNPNRLRIKTIDSFNVLLTRQLPLLSHFGAPPEIMDYPQSLYSQAVQLFLAHLEEDVEWSDAIAQLLLHLDNDMQKVEALLIEMLAKRDQWLPYIAPHRDHSLRKTLENHLSAVITDSLLTLKKRFPVDCTSDLLTLLRFAAKNLKTLNPTSTLTYCGQLSDLPGVTPADKVYWLGISELLFTKEAKTWRQRFDQKMGFPPLSKAKSSDKNILKMMQQKLKELIEHLSQGENLHQAFIELHHLPADSYSSSQWEILNALHEVLKLSVAQLKVIFQQYGKIDYIENAQAALTALGDEEAPTDLALSLDYHIQHILIDEFQDTSNTQYRLLEKLISGWQEHDNKTLFLVGDPMQSIYRFREAEVGLFIRARQHGIGSIKLKPLTLSVNFRSTPLMVNWINEHFTKIMPCFDDIGNGAISYTPSVANHKHLKHSSETVAVQLHTSIHTHMRTQAKEMIHLIEQTLQQNPQEEIAILVRSRNHLEYIIPALKKANLAYQAIDIDPLETRPVIQDLLALTRALLYPADRIAWLSILRAPWCGLTLSDLLLLIGNNRHEIIWQRLQEPQRVASLSLEGQERLSRILPVLQLQMTERYRESIHAWVEKTWLLLGGPACVENESDLEDTNIFFNLLKNLQQQEGKIKWESLKNSLRQLYAQSKHPLTDCRIHIMTIHNAKGLEFDTVILPHLERKAPSNKKPLLSWLERPLQNNSTALLLAPIHATEDQEDKLSTFIKRQEKIKTDYEQTRLLYVAATRAKKALHLFMTLTIDQDGKIEIPQDSSLLKKLWPAIEGKASCCFATCPQDDKSANQSEEDKIRNPIKRLPSQWSNPIQPPPKTERPPHNKIQGFHLSQMDAQCVGMVVHHLLQQISRLGFSWWEIKSSTEHNHYIQTLLLQNGAHSSQIISNSIKVELAIQNTLNDKQGRWILHQHREAQSELALTAIIEQQARMMVIDRTFIDDNNIRWIIDYKTSFPHNQDLTTFLQEEKGKYAKQMQQYHQAMKMMDSRQICLGLYFPLIPAWQSITV